uniref:Uncharacterized protein n=1 Tax=Panagrolaimus sp. PS1159 TaxID=55785 RepID=A0AC35GUB9_9BILA
MRKSIDLKGGFIIVVIFAFIVTLVSIFTPAWKVSNYNDNNQGLYQRIGLVTIDCGGKTHQAQIDQRQLCEKQT